MNCSRVDRLAERFIDGRLAGRLAGRVRIHLAGCERCRMRVEEARSTTRALSRPAGLGAPEGFSQRVMARVYREEERAARRGVQARRSYRRLGFAFMATASILTASLFIPRIAYPDLIRPQALAAELAPGRPQVVARVLSDAGVGFRDVVLSGRSKAARP